MKYNSFYSVPLVPSNFSIAGQFETTRNITITFEWSLPLGEGSELVVDYYIVAISLTLLSQNDYEIIVNTTVLNVTVMYNTEYTFTVSAINCAGESDVSELFFMLCMYLKLM